MLWIIFINGSPGLITCIDLSFSLTDFPDSKIAITARKCGPNLNRNLLILHQVDEGFRRSESGPTMAGRIEPMAAAAVSV
jgi:hypothetical protein